MSGDIHRLEGSSSQIQGGLVIRKKNNDDDKFVEPKLPFLENKSKLGLDKLAASKAKEAKELVKFKERSQDHNKRYRESKEETPTWTGGVSFEAKKRKEERREKDRESRGHYYSSKNDKKSDQHGYRHREDYHRKDRDRRYGYLHS